MADMSKRKRRASAVEPVAAQAGGKALVIVESPTKAKTINKYLGSGYVVKACKGHVRDLPQRQYGVDPGRNFEPTYEILHSHQKIVEELRTAAAHATMVYLATDLDREGEAIAWHLMQALELTPAKVCRVVFNEITKSAVADAFAHPHELDTGKVDAQQARRILDRMVGYELSPLLWKKVAKGLSAGRVQSVAVRMIVDREEEIRRFEPQENWAIDAMLTAKLDQAVELAARWRSTMAPTAKAGAEAASTAKDRAAWLEEHGCLKASLAEVAGRPFKAEGKLKRQGETPKSENAETPKTPRSGLTGGASAHAAARAVFHSAVEAVRPIAEALGFHVAEVAEHAWEQYSHLGLKQIELVGEIQAAKAPAFTVKSIDTKRSTSKPPGPFTTASLQQAAANQLRFSTSRTMKIAQSLYEGVDLKTGEGNVGLITYMRTDSTNLSAESVEAVRGFIRQNYGDRYLPPSPNRYGSAKGAQEAHEAIRPTDVTRTPESVCGHVTPEQHKLYTLIWKRFTACQMALAQWDATTVLITASTPVGEAVFKATGRVLVFDGFYQAAGVPRNGDEPMLPPLKVGQRLAAIAVEPQQKFTSPPPRYTEASLVKTLEAEGIGRPSTYAAIIQTIQDRGYVEQEDRKFRPTHRGEIVTAKLVAHFPEIMDVRFTSHVEADLDKIEEQRLDWHDVLHEFYDPFKVALAKAHQEMDAVRAEPSEYACEACGKPMVYRLGRNGRFLSCTGYPECTSTRDVDAAGKMIQRVQVDVKCDVCGKPMILRRSKRGPFLGCSGYPECATTRPCSDEGVPLNKIKAEDVKQNCPECGKPMHVKFARGRAFLGCSGYPSCKTTSPMPEGVYVERPKPEEAGARCDKCGRPMVIRRSRRGPFLSCSGFPKCRNAMPMEKLDHLKAMEAAGQVPDAPTGASGTGAKNGAAKNGGVYRNGAAKARGKATRMSPEEIAALGPPPHGFEWTRTGRPVVDIWPEGELPCFSCGGPMTLRHGRFGPFYSCDKCKSVANLRGDAKKRAEAEAPVRERVKPIQTDVSCPDCAAKMMLRMGKTGRFLGCSRYPACRKTMEAPPGLLREVAETATT